MLISNALVLLLNFQSEIELLWEVHHLLPGVVVNVRNNTLLHDGNQLVST